MATFRALLLALVTICLSSTTEQSISVFQTAEIISSNGYPSETHHVTTSDGYILEMHRIPHGKGQAPSSDRPVVFLMHGLTAASNSYIILGPDYAPAYNLADGGFDIWMGNARGNRNSRYHVSLNPDHFRQKLRFFDFSFEEIGVIDIPAMIDYILQYTGHETLHYIGHSQGGTAFLIMNSMRPEYNKKIKSAHLLAGVGYQKYFPNKQLAAVARFTDTIYNVAVAGGFVELSPPSTDELPADRRVSHCSGDERTDYMCELIGVRHLMRENTLDNDLSSFFEDYESAGAALKQIAHYGQNIRDKAFRRWSYGSIRNRIIYRSSSPPAYDLSLITINTTMHYTVNDNLLDERDVLAMAADMPNAIVRKVGRDTFLHEDFVAATDARELVTNYIVASLRRDSGLPTFDNSGIEESDRNPENEDNIIVEAVLESTLTGSAHSFVTNNIYHMCLMLVSVYLTLL